MSAVRRSITSSPQARDRFVEGVLRLASEPAGITTREVNEALRGRVPGRIQGRDQPLTTWDLFVLWHHVTMMLPASPARPLRNQAHGGPVFLPWHRMFLLRLEQQLQRVLGDPDAALPYWDWAADGERPVPTPAAGPPWGDGGLGPARGEVRSGPLGALRVRLVASGTQLWSVAPRPLTRSAGTDTDALPTRDDVVWALGADDYDRSPWDAGVPAFRNRLEGWHDRSGTGAPQLHNRVHVWVGGDMSAGSSPNDPVFWLNHNNVDRLWEAWMQRHGRRYRPTQDDGDAPRGHRRDDPMVALLGGSLRPADVLDPSSWYSYDSLAV